MVKAFPVLKGKRLLASFGVFRGVKQPESLADDATGLDDLPYVEYLFRYTKQDDLVIGTPISGRNWPEVEELIGYFSNTLVLRMKVSGRETFRFPLRRLCRR